MKPTPMLLFLLTFWSVHLFGQNPNSIFKKYERIENNKNLTLFEKKERFDALVEAAKDSSDLDKIAQEYYSFLKKFYGIKRYDLAADCSLKIRSIGSELGTEQEEFYVKNDKNLANLYYRNKDYYKVISAGNYFVKTHTNDTMRLGGVYRFLGNAYNDIGDFERALSYYNKSIYLFQQLNDVKEEGKTLNNVLEIYVKRKDKTYNNEAVQVIQILDTIQGFKLKDAYASALNRGAYYSFLDNLSKAKEHYNAALEMMEKEEDSLGVFSCLVNLGTIERKEGNLATSKTFFQKAQNFTLNYPDKNASLYNNWADTYRAEKDTVKTLAYYNKAIDEIFDRKSEFNTSLKNLELNPYKIDLLGYLLDKASFLIEINAMNHQQEYLKEILEAYILADKVVDMIYFESREDLSKLFWREQAAEMYSNAANTAFHLNDWDQVFYFVEKSKALLLLENVTESNAKMQANLSEAIMEREFQLKRNIRTAESMLSDSKVDQTSKRTMDSLKNKVFTEKQRYASFVDSLETTIPAYYKYKKKVEVFNVKETQASLSKDEVVLQYKFTPERGFLTLVTSETIDVLPLTNIDQIDQNIQDFTKALQQPFSTQEDQSRFQRLGFELFQQLLPFAKDDSIILKGKKLIVIPEGRLHSIPFEALVVNKNQPLNESYLLYDCDVRYAYSFSSLMSSSTVDSTFDHDFFAVQPSEFLSASLPSLKLTDTEIGTFETLLDTKLVTHDAATKESFLNEYGQSKVVHISTHGGVSNTIPWIALHDQKLMLNDIYFKNKQPELVVLSACKTLQGEYKQGEGIMSVSRAFIKSGAKSVVSSLWDINQKSSNELIFNFYENLKKGESSSVALRNAKLNYLQTNKNTSQASPYYWSGLIFTGDDSIVLNQNNWIWWVILSIIILVSFYFLQKKYKKRAM